MKKIYTLLIVFTFVFPATLLADCKIKPPARTKFEEMFGKPEECYPKDAICFDIQEQKKIECPVLPKGTVCYSKSGVYFKAIFDSEENLKQLNMSGDGGYIYDNARQLIPESWKGLWSERERRKSAKINLPVGELEKYSDDCLELENGAENRMNTDYLPFIMSIKWK